jgi:hypothetical protein
MNMVIKTGSTAMVAIAALFLLSCGRPSSDRTLTVEPGRRFDGFQVTKIWEKDLYGRWCLPCPNGVVCSELADRGNREYFFYLFDYAGNLVKQRKVPAGKGPNEIQGGDADAVWLSSPRTITVIDADGYVKAMDSESLDISSILKLSNVIPGYSSRFDIGRISGTPWDEKGGLIVTTFESAGFYEDLTYYLVSMKSDFRDFKIHATEKKAKPISWIRMDESRRKGQARLVSLTDYYGRWRIFRNFSVDWKRGVAYLIPDIEKPEIESINLQSDQKQKYSIDIEFTKFPIERAEFDSFYEYAESETAELLKQRTKRILYLPPHAPALMGAMVVGDHLLLITGNRNWQKGENETLVYHLPDLVYKGSFAIPYSNIQKTKWSEPYYINVNRVKKEEDYSWRYEIFRLTERPPGGLNE